MQAFARNPHYQIHHPSEGQVLDLPGVAVTIKVAGKATDGAFAIIESTVPPHYGGTPAYIHARATITFYIISGVLAFTLAEETVMVRQGGFVVVPPGLLHKFWNPTAAPATYLTYLSPAGFEEYLAELATLAAQEPAWPPLDLNKIAALDLKYDLLPTQARSEVGSANGCEKTA